MKKLWAVLLAVILVVNMPLSALAASLKMIKEVPGGAINEEDTFTFQVQFQTTDSPPPSVLYEIYETGKSESVGSGTIAISPSPSAPPEIKLKDGQYAYFEGLPEDGSVYGYTAKEILDEGSLYQPDQAEFTGYFVGVEEEITFTNRKLITTAVVTLPEESKSAIYNGEAQAPKLTVKLGGEILVEGTDYAISWRKEGNDTNPIDPKDVGKYIGTISGIGGYVGMVQVNFEIIPCPLTVKAADSFEVEVGDNAPDLSNPVLGTHYTVIGFPEAEANKTLSTAPTLSYGSTPDMSKPGEYAINISGGSAGDNYEISQYIRQTDRQNRVCEESLGSAHRRRQPAAALDGAVPVEPDRHDLPAPAQKARITKPADKRRALPVKSRWLIVPLVRPAARAAFL